MRSHWLERLLENVADRGRELLHVQAAKGDADSMEEWCRRLLTGRGEASSIAIARDILAKYAESDDAGRERFLEMLYSQFGPELQQISRTANQFLESRDDDALLELMRAVEPPRQELFRRLNMAPYGTRALVHMRSDVIRLSKHAPQLRLVDADLTHLLGSWFNRGFLRLERIEWSSPALILEKLITYESVHEIKGWHDLRRRLAPDRRCFAFFHPALRHEPLIFVEVALVTGIATSVAPLLDQDSSIVNPRHADTAIFYSINNTQHGLRGISFGNFLIKQVLTELQQELPWLTTFATLSPIPRLSTALREIAAGRTGDGLDRDLLDQMLAHFGDVLHGITGIDDPIEAFFASLGGKYVEQREALAPVLRNVVLAYLSMARRRDGTVHDTVAAFHLANGAAIERINPFADQSKVGYRHSYGCMVNYLYDPETVVVNHERFVNTGKITMSKTLAREYNKMKSLRVIQDK